MEGIDTHTSYIKSSDIDKNAKYHFIAIGGVGQSALAKILLKLGYRVSGSDIAESKYTKELKDLGAKIFIGHLKENVPDDACVVVSSAIKEDNQEYLRAKELNLKILHRSDLLKDISDLFGCFVGFSGTHGKTTTSGFMSYVMTKMGQNPSYAIGGIIPNLKTNADASKNSSYFIAELDESDGTIVKYQPELTVINNLEADHLDFYKNGLDDVLDTFSRFLINLVNDDSKVLINIDNSGCLKLLEKNKDFYFITYALDNKTAKYTARNIYENNGFTYFDVYIEDDYKGTLTTALKGIHNVYNVLSVAASLLELNFEFEDFAPCFDGFSGMARRFERVYKDDYLEVIDDYAHHPTEIKATLEASERHTKGRVVVVFQPHRYTRLKALWDDFVYSFDNCDVLIVLDTWSAGDKFDEHFNSENFAKEVKHGCVKYIKGSINEAADKIIKLLEYGDTVLTIGAGDITKLGRILGEYYAGN